MAKKKHECPEPENTERWAVSYLDMITVMMCLFLVLYAISQVDSGKLAKLSKSLAAGFNQSLQVVSPLHTTSGLGLLSGSTSAVNLGSMMGNDTTTAAGQPERIQAMAEASHLNQIKQQVEQALASAGQTGALQMRITEKGLVLGMVASDTYFKPGDAEVQPTAQAVLAALAPVLAGTPEDVAIEGYADPNPQYSAKYPSNYHLAAGRAIEVLIHLRSGGVPGSKLRTISYGADHQTQVEAGQDAWSLNRRVDIVIMSRAKDSVRAMLPEAAKQLSQGLPQAPTGPQAPQIGSKAGGGGNAPETSGTSNQTGKNGGTLRSEVRTVN
ncbi:OmpA/MotB family protein [Mobiluncus mulieris]|uniref:Chemotaxis protein MotB n=1 Tax=Mobiluncus mulieris TaxID=2052 RepID=A0A8G2HT63_9ACTO|nr:flagellar motor protein MotB [Mobiluncus mulieris]MBB5847067.1 chemotaxis protein MotB [Mobiluncus mulieris]MCU9968030.1 flagellar motor protein MotB [Mobiluncus mulieris]MCV0009084.1 flagellar motor protein MotB [Mobiluncus mulieris]NMW74755.1 flagellar motor protein MotB [Mobiluncus mulieris]NMX00932.1 flagellar motor protein MotB [Mobiluncus mulieris]